MTFWRKGDDFSEAQDRRVLAVADMLAARGDTAAAYIVRDFVAARPAWYVGGMNDALHAVLVGALGSALLCFATYAVVGEMPYLAAVAAFMMNGYWLWEVWQGKQQGRLWDLLFVGLGVAFVIVPWREAALHGRCVDVPTGGWCVDLRLDVGWACAIIALFTVVLFAKKWTRTVAK